MTPSSVTAEGVERGRRGRCTLGFWRLVLGLRLPPGCRARPSGWGAPRASHPCVARDSAEAAKLKPRGAQRPLSVTSPPRFRNIKSCSRAAGLSTERENLELVQHSRASSPSLPHVGSSAWRALTSHSNPSVGCTQAPGALPQHYLLATVLVRPGNKWLRDPLVSRAARPRPVLGQAAGSASA